MRNRGFNYQSMNNVQKMTILKLSDPILLRTVRTRSLRRNTSRFQILLKIIGHIFFLELENNIFNTRRKLSLKKSNKSLKNREHIGFRLKEIYPSETIIVINEGHEILILSMRKYRTHTSFANMNNLKARLSSITM